MTNQEIALEITKILKPDIDYFLNRFNENGKNADAEEE